jgi:hypothetical protein
MSVLSWRLLSSASLSPRSPSSLLGSGTIRHILIIIPFVLAGGCVAKAKKPDLLFDTGSLTDAQWTQVNKECQFEAEKVVAPIRPSPTAGEQFREIYILCVETKGVKFLGTSDKVRR